MYWGKYHLGLRTVKTSLAVMLCILFFDLTNRGTPIVATLAAVFALREDLSTSIDFGKSRIIGNTIGGACAFIYYASLQLMPSERIGQLILIPLLVAVIITYSNRIDNTAGIIGGVATFIFIALSIPRGESYLYAFNRVIDTFIGTIIAVFINFALKSPLENKEESIEDKLELIMDKKAEIKVLENEIKKMNK